MAEDRIVEVPAARKRLIPVELVREQVVDRAENLGSRAVVPRKREALRSRCPALTEHGDIGVAEAVDRLELVTDIEHVGVLTVAAQQVDDVALEAVRVLELVDHDLPEAELLELPDRSVVAQEVTHEQLEVLEVEDRFTSLRLLVRSCEQVEQLLQVLTVARSELVERSLAEAVARSPESTGALADRGEVREIEQLFGVRPEGERGGRGGLLLLRGARIRGELAGGVLELREPLVDACPGAELEAQLAPGRAKRLVDAGQLAAKTGGAVRGEQTKPFGVSIRAERGQRARRTPLPPGPAPGRRRARGNADRCRPRTDAHAAGARRNRGWSRPMRRRGGAQDRDDRARGGRPGCERGAHRLPSACT